MVYNWQSCNLAFQYRRTEEVSDYESNPKVFAVSAARFPLLAGAFAAAQRPPAGEFTLRRGKLV